MTTPGFSATAALARSGGAYRTGFSQARTGDRAGVHPALTVNVVNVSEWALWCVYCGLRGGFAICPGPGLTSCYCGYPIPHSLLTGLEAWPAPIDPGGPIEGGGVLMA